MNLEVSPLFVHIPLFVMNINFELQVYIYIFSNGRDRTKCQFLHGDNDVNDNAKILAIPRVFSEKCRANNKIIEAIFWKKCIKPPPSPQLFI